MSKIKINGEEIEGRFSMATENVDGILHSYGQIVTKTYFEEIKEIENRRYFISNVEVYKEEFGSEDDEILYTFNFDGLQIKED